MTRRLAEMTWPEVERAVAAGCTTVILPLGATEQHGPHLPLGTDTVRAAFLATQLGARRSDFLVAPAIPIGCSDEHTGFSGLLSLDPETLAGLIVDCARRMTAWGVRRLVLLSAHGGNARALELARARLKEQAGDLEVAVLTSSKRLDRTLADIAAADGIKPDEAGLHAGESETSEMLHLRPELVHMDRAVAGYTGSMADVRPLLRQVGLRQVTATGTLGDPRAACPERGRNYLRVQIDDLLQMLPADAGAHTGEAVP